MSDKYICGACGAELQGMNYRCSCAGQTEKPINEWIERYERMKESYEEVCGKLARLEPELSTGRQRLEVIQSALAAQLKTAQATMAADDAEIAELRAAIVVKDDALRKAIVYIDEDQSTIGRNRCKILISALSSHGQPLLDELATLRAVIEDLNDHGTTRILASPATGRATE